MTSEFLAFCSKCSWKVVTDSPAANGLGHRQKAGEGHDIQWEEHISGHKTMKHADSIRLGHCQCKSS